MIRFMLDTNVCIDLLRGGEGISAMLARLCRCEPGEVAISSITFAELQHGIFKSVNPAKNLSAVIDFCAALEILPFDGIAAEAYGQIRATLERAGTPIGPLDTLIAAHAIAAQCTLVTGNEREFQRVPNLTVENWRNQ